MPSVTTIRPADPYPQMPSPVRTLRSRVFLGGQAVSMLGDGLAILAIPLLVLRLTRSPVAAVLASLPGSVGYLAAGLPAGVLVDRLDPWRVLIAGDVIRAAIFLALFWFTGSRSAAASLILTLAFAAGAVTVFSDTALTIAVRDVFAGARLMTANSWLESANQLGQIIGPTAAGLLAAAGLLHVSMLLDALTFLVALASILGVRLGYPGAPRTRPSRADWRALRRELAGGIRYLAATRVLFTLLVFMLVLNLCLGADKLIIFFARNSLHLPPDQVGLVVTAGGVGGLLGAAGTSLLCRWLGPLPAVTLGAASSGLALLMDRRSHLDAGRAGREPALHPRHHRGQRDHALAAAGARAPGSAGPGHGLVAARRPGRHADRPDRWPEHGRACWAAIPGRYSPAPDA